MESVERARRSEVLGVTVGVVAGLLTVALCHYLGVVRLSLMLALLIPYRYAGHNGRYPAVASYLHCWKTAAVIAGPISA